MYELKPIIKHNIPIDLPSTMYEMKNIYGAFNGDKSNGTNHDVVSPFTSHIRPDIRQQIRNVLKAQNNGDLQALQQRQVTILEQLKELKSKLVSMHKQLGICAKPAQAVAHKPAAVKLELKPIQTKYLQEVVVNVNPKNIPYSLATLQTLWSNRLNIVVQCYVHSTIAEISASAKDFATNIQLAKSNPTLPTLNVSLIWKDVAVTELQCAPTTFIPIFGEVNILRYLSRVGPNEYAYESSIVQAAEIDSILDVCHQFITVSTQKERSAILKKLNVRLGRSEYFNGASLGVVDVALHSAVQQLNISAKDLTPPLVNWQRRINDALLCISNWYNK